LRIQVQDLAGEPLESAVPPTVSVRSDEFDLGQRTMVADDVGTLQTTVILPEPGQWRVQVGIRIDEFTNPVATLQFVVRAT
jgi:copper transport protein